MGQVISLVSGDAMQPRPLGARVFPDFGQQVPDPDSRYGYRDQYSEITFPRLTAILSSADRGFTESWAELSRRMLRTDSHLASVYETRLVGVAGARWEIDVGTDGGDDEINALAAKDCRALLEGLGDLERFFRMLLDGIGVGYSVHEILWTIRRNLVVPERMEWIHPRRFRFDEHYQVYLWDDGRAAGYAPRDQLVQGSGAWGMRLTPDKYVVHIPRVVPDYAPMSGLLQTVARQWWVRQWAVKYWLMGAELAGNPKAITSVPQETNAATIAEIRDAWEHIAADGVVVLKKPAEVVLQAPLAQGAASVWAELADRMAADESKAILGSTNNVETAKNGDRATAQSQFDTTIMPRAQADGRAAWTTIERDVFRPFLRFNAAKRYGGRMPAIPRGRFILSEETQAPIDAIAVNAGAVTIDELRAKHGLPALGKERGGDRLIAPPSAAPAFAQQIEIEAPAQPAPGGAPAAAPFRSTERPWQTATRICSAAASQMSQSSSSKTRAATAPAARSRASAAPSSSRGAPSRTSSQLGLDFSKR